MGDRNNKPPDNPWFKNLSQLAGPSTRSNAAGSSRSNAAGPSRSYVAGSSRPVAAGSSRLIPAGSSKPNAGELPEKFLKASAQMMKSASKYAHSFESSSDEEDLQEDSILSSIMKEYSSEGKDKSYDRTREFLEQSFQSGATVCLICIASVKRIQPIWSCEVCYTALHLPCLQRWANGTVQHQTEPIDPLLSDTIIRMRPTRNIEWCCPKCRTSYSKEQIPNFYMCFCKQKRNPEYQPWLIPHSCGATCDKPLIPDCGHNCLLLCHPGACPPCPKMIIIECYCEKNPAKPIRCNMKGWSCDKICNKLLSCCTHKCELQCHSGPCYACVKTTLQFCRCQKSESARPCESLEWICGMPCDKKFSCGFHLCEKICHEGPCGNCPYTGIQKCPCGCFQMEVSCPDVVVPCGSTCNKVLPCFEHHCPNKCHRGPCDQCLKLVDKTCFCGLHEKQLPCYKQFYCDTKCKKVKNCGRHACSKKCCSGNCLPCDKICGKTLECKKHKCPNVCHQDFCYPCPLTSRIACRCGETGYSVPCGHEKKNKPPKCSKNCKILPSCNHIKENYHKCHFGPCPPCKQQCGKELPCGHKCTAMCHNAVPILLHAPKPAGPWDVQAPKVEIRTLPCPPCNEKVIRPCLGGHEECEMPCVEARVSSCGRKCGKPLSCTNHTCSRDCHPFEPEDDDNSKCELCTRSCEFALPENCKHPCKKGCHPPPCDLCQQYVKKQCHCGITELYVRCYMLTLAEDLESTLSCKQQCSRMVECNHRCSITCHSGQCPNDCSKKTKVRCPCGRIKKDIPCNLVKSEESAVLCDKVCEEKKIIQNTILAEVEMKRMQEEMAKNERELLEYENKFGKRRHREPRTKNNSNDKKQPGIISKYKYAIITSVIVVLSIGISLVTINI